MSFAGGLRTKKDLLLWKGLISSNRRRRKQFATPTSVIPRLHYEAGSTSARRASSSSQLHDRVNGVLIVYRVGEST